VIRSYRGCAVFFLLGLLQACVNAPTQTQVPASTPTQGPVRKITCTLLGCEDTFYLGFTGEMPSSYIVIATTSEGQTAIVHCLWDYQAPSGQDALDFGGQRYPLRGPEATRIRGESAAFDLCESDEGFVTEGYSSRIEDDSASLVKTITIHCGEPISADSYSAHCTSAASSLLEPGGVILYSFLPEFVTVTVYWDGYSKTESLRPTYTISRPNGSDCAPECRSGGFGINVP